MSTSDVVISTRGLRVSYGGHDVLEGIDLSVPRGEVMAVIGANGSGKSSLVRAMIGLAPVTSGSVELFGSPRLTRRLRERIGYVPQRVSAAGGVPATVTEVVRTGLLSGLFRRTTKDWRIAVDEALATTGLTEHRNRPVGDLSGGQQQRVLIARALVRNPELLILDEPLAGVDLAQQESFARTLAALSAERRTIVLVLHEFGAIAPLLTRVISLADGAIEFDASPDMAPQHCETNDHPDWVRAAHDHVHPHDNLHQQSPDWMPEALPARGASQ